MTAMWKREDPKQQAKRLRKIRRSKRFRAVRDLRDPPTKPNVEIMPIPPGMNNWHALTPPPIANLKRLSRAEHRFRDDWIMYQLARGYSVGNVIQALMWHYQTTDAGAGRMVSAAVRLAAAAVDRTPVSEYKAKIIAACDRELLDPTNKGDTRIRTLRLLAEVTGCMAPAMNVNLAAGSGPLLIMTAPRVGGGEGFKELVVDDAKKAPALPPGEGDDGR